MQIGRREKINDLADIMKEHMPSLITLCSVVLGRHALSYMFFMGEVSISGTMIKVDELANAL